MLESMKPYLILLLAILAAGCITTEIDTGAPHQYELPGINNTTIYYLNLSTIQVVESVINQSSVKLVIGDSGDMDFRDPVAVDYAGNNVTFNISKGAIFGRSFVRFDFNSSFSGFIAYTQSDGQDFTRQLTDNGSVRVVLPEGYTTGSNFLGIAQPPPDNITTDSRGRDVLIWNNPYPQHQMISVKYYQRDAPAALLYFFIFLLIAAVVIFGYYRLSLRALKKKRNIVEKGKNP
jgi:hypothetical protein